MGCSWGACFHAKKRRYFRVLFRERSRCDNNLKRGRFTFRGEVAKTATAWPNLGFGWRWSLRTSAAGLESPRGIFRRQDAPKKPFKYTLERRYSARVAGKLRARRARGGATRYSHSAENRLWGYNRGARSHAKARRGICVLFRERPGRGGSSMRGCFTAGACQCVQHGRRQRGQSWVLGGAGPSHLRGWPGEPQGRVSTERCTKKTYWLCPGRA